MSLRSRAYSTTQEPPSLHQFFSISPTPSSNATTPRTVLNKLQSRSEEITLINTSTSKMVQKIFSNRVKEAKYHKLRPKLNNLHATVVGGKVFNNQYQNFRCFFSYCIAYPWILMLRTYHPSKNLQQTTRFSYPKP